MRGRVEVGSRAVAEVPVKGIVILSCGEERSLQGQADAGAILEGKGGDRGLDMDIAGPRDGVGAACCVGDLQLYAVVLLIGRIGVGGTGRGKAVNYGPIAKIPAINEI